MTHRADGGYATCENLDPRIQLGFVVLALAAVLTSASLKPPALLTGFGLVGACRQGIKIRELFRRSAAPVIMALVMLVTHVLFYGQTPLIYLDIGPVGLTGYLEGWRKGVTLVFRMTAGISLMLYLSTTTPVHRLIAAVRWFRLPQPLVEVLELAYRYLFVLREEAGRINQAQKARLGYAHWRVGLKSGSTLGGVVLIRAFDRGERLYQSMCCRGYRGQFAGPVTFSFTRSGLRHVFGLLLVLIVAVLIR